MTAKSKTQSGASSEHSPSFKAYRIAEKLDKQEYIRQLMDFVKQETNKDKKRAAYFTIGKIAKNTQDKTTAIFLIERVEDEEDESVLIGLLDAIADLSKPKETDISPLLKATKDGRHFVKHAAMMSLKNSENEKAEERLLEIAANSNNEYDLFYAVWALNSVGTAKSIPSFINLTKYNKIDVAFIALGNIIKVGGCDYMPLYLEHLDKGKLKSTALSGVIKYGDEKVIPSIIKRVKELVSKKRKMLSVTEKNRTELIDAMEFLTKYAAQKDVAKLYHSLRSGKNALLWDIEQKWLTDNASKFDILAKP